MKRFNSGASSTQVSARLALAAAIAAACAAPAFAQEAAPAAKSGIEEVIVTGTKRAESSQDVPIAVTAVSSDQMEKTFRNDILAVSDLAPGVALGQMAGFRAIAGGIRGTGQNGILVTQDSSVAILVDEFGLNNVQAQFVETFDVERIEVYRGPQGTLFGKNATGGAISIVTKRPVMNEFSGDVGLQYGKYSEHGAGIVKGKAAINIPLIEDKLAMRIVGIYDYEEGYFRNNKAANNFPNYQPIWDADGDGVSLPLPDALDTTSQGAGEHLGGVDVFAAKIKLLWTPTDNYEAYFFTEHSRDRSESVPNVNDSPALGELDHGVPQFMLVPLLGFDGIPATGGSVYDTGMDASCWSRNAFCLDTGHRVSVDGYHLHQKLETDKITYQFLAGYREQKEILPSNYVGEAFMSLYDASRNLERETTQFELRASSNLDGPFNFVAGLTYQTDDVDMIAYQTVGLLSLVTFLPPGPGDVVPGFLDANGQLKLDLDYINDPQMQGAVQDRKTYAGYFDGTYEVTDRWRLTAGLRYTKDKKEFNRRMNPGAPCGPLTPAKDCVPVTQDDGSVVLLDRRSNAVSRSGLTLAQLDTYKLPSGIQFSLNKDLKDDWQKVTYRLVSNYDVTDDAMWYVSYATGFISGGFTEQCSSETTCVPFDPETNWNLETGLKSRWLDGTVQANLAAYLTRYKDLVRSQVVPFVDIFGNPGQETINVNAGESEIYGLEAELTWMPMDNLRLDLNTAYQHHEYKEFDLNGVDYSDYTVPYSPKWKVGVSATYTWELGSAGHIAANTSVNYQSTAEMSVFNSLYSQMNRRTLWDANVTWSDAEDRYDITLWIKNILDQEYRIGSNSVAGLWNMTTYGRPQSMGIEVGVHF